MATTPELTTARRAAQGSSAQGSSAQAGGSIQAPDTAHDQAKRNRQDLGKTQRAEGVSSMTAKIQDLQREHDALQAELNTIDLAPLAQDLADAKAAQSAHREPTQSFVVSETDRELSRTVALAESALTNAKNKMRDLSRQLQPLALLLSAPARLQAAREDLATLQSRAADAATVMAIARATKTALRGLLADAQADYAGQVEDAAKAVLAGAKQGKAIASTPTDRGQVDALESALAMAQAELDIAQARHEESLSDLAAGQRQQQQAVTDAAALRFELQLRDFVDAVCAFEFAGGSFDAADLSERCAVAIQNAAGLRDSLAEENAAG